MKIFLFPRHVNALPYIILIMLVPPVHGQIEYLGLSDKDLTSLDINYGILAAGSHRDGVYWQFESTAPDTAWQVIEAPNLLVEAVYPHKSGPLGWAISAGVERSDPESPAVYCSFMGEPLFANSEGIDPENGNVIGSMDGYPDPTVCGETYAAGGRAVYRRWFADTVWHPVFNTTVEGAVYIVRVRQEYPGVVLAGGADGFAGILLVKSTDFGDSWTDISPFGQVLDVDFWGDSASTIFAVLSHEVQRTLDGGLTWESILQAGSERFLSEIVYDPLAGKVYVAGLKITGEPHAVILVSDDNGDSWTEYDLDSYGPVLAIDMGSNDWLYFVSQEDGVYRFKDPVSDIDDHPASGREVISEIQLMPNPADRAAEITYILNKAGVVTIRLIDEAGKHVSWLKNQYEEEGRHTTGWNTSDYPSGVYFISIHADDHIVTKKAIISH